MSTDDDKMERLLQSIESLNGTVRLVAADTESTREMVGVVRDRMTNFEERLTVLERADNRHVEWRKSISDADAKSASDQAAIVIALEETRKAAQDALAVSKQSDERVKEAVDASKQAYEAARLAFATATKGLTAITTVKSNQETQGTTLMEIKTEEQKKPKLPVALAAVINLLVGLVWLILELVHRTSH